MSSSDFVYIMMIIKINALENMQNRFDVSNCCVKMWLCIIVCNKYM